MKSLRVYVALSLFLHAAFFGAVVFTASRKPRPAYDVYEVSIVAAPAPGSQMQTPSREPSPKMPSPLIKGFEQIAKAQAVKDKAPSFKPIDLEKGSSRPREAHAPDMEEPEEEILKSVPDVPVAKV